MLSTQPDLERMSTLSRSGKTKDENKDRPPSRHKCNASARNKGKALATASYSADSPDSVGGPGGGGSAEDSYRNVDVWRSQKELLARGIKGVALTSAVQAWDRERGVSNVTDDVFAIQMRQYRCPEVLLGAR